jgi:hypothetical protein
MIPPIKKYIMDESLSWEERYKQLDAHHYKETSWYARRLDTSFGYDEIKIVAQQVGEAILRRLHQTHSIKPDKDGKCQYASCIEMRKIVQSFK